MNPQLAQLTPPGTEMSSEIRTLQSEALVTLRQLLHRLADAGNNLPNCQFPSPAYFLRVRQRYTDLLSNLEPRICALRDAHRQIPGALRVDYDTAELFFDMQTTRPFSWRFPALLAYLAVRMGRHAAWVADHGHENTATFDRRVYDLYCDMWDNAGDAIGDVLDYLVDRS